MKHKPALLDLFSCEGGAGVGYSRAGFRVYSVDLNGAFANRNPFPFYEGDALQVLADLMKGYELLFTDQRGRESWMGLSDFALIHASPPCQAYSIATAGNPSARAKHERLIAGTRRLLQRTGLPWIIENVEMARSQMVNPVRLCGRMFGLGAHEEAPP